MTLADRMLDPDNAPRTLYSVIYELRGWTEWNFPDAEIRDHAIGLGEESGEVLRAILKRHQMIRGTHEEWTAELYKELGDVMIKVLGICIAEGVDVLDILADRWADIRLRDMRVDPKLHGIEGS